MIPNEWYELLVLWVPYYFSLIPVPYLVGFILGWMFSAIVPFSLFRSLFVRIVMRRSF